MVEFGEQLRIAREKKGMMQQTLADQLFVSRQSVSRWERGERYPDLITTKNLSRILDVSLDTLLSGKEMIKVAERTPVVENKLVNNMAIALYAIVVISFFIKIAEKAMILFIQSFKSLSESRPMNYMHGSEDERIVVLRYIIYVIIFLFALYHAIKDTFHDLSKSRMFFPAASMVTTTARETAADFVLGIAVFVLIVYQTHVLYRKRITAVNLSAE